MPKYEVTLRSVDRYIVEVEAETKEEATEKAWDMKTENPSSYYSDSDGETESVNELN